MKNSRCLNLACPLRGKVSSGNIVRHGFYRTRSGKRRRYRCGECGKTFSSKKGTPYYRLQHRRATFDGVIALRVEGVSISSISRIEGIAWNAVARWLEKAAQVCRRFNHTRIAGFGAEELQADEIRTFTGNKKTPSWVFVTIEVWSRLWPSTVTGRRSYRNTHALFHDLSRRMNFEHLPLIVTDGFEFYQKVIRRFFGPACLYGQVLKTRRNDRIIKVERRALHGAAWRFDDALNNSEDNNTNVSKLVFDFIAGWEKQIGEETIVQAGQLPIFRNDDGKGAWLQRPNSVLVDSQQLESGESMSNEFKKIAAREIEEFKAEYRSRFPGRDVDNLTNEDLLPGSATDVTETLQPFLLLLVQLDFAVGGERLCGSALLR